MNSNLIRKSKHGLTLIEVIVALAIFSIVMGLAFSIFRFTNKSFSLGVDQYNTQSETRMVSEYLLSSVRFSSDISIETIDTGMIDISTLDPDYNYIYVKNNVLHHLISKNQSLTEKTLGNNIASASFSIENSQFSLDLSGIEDEQSFSVQSDIDLPNIRLKSESSTSSTGNFIKYKNSSTVDITNSNYVIVVHERPMYFIENSAAKKIEYDIIPSLPDHTVTFSSYDESIATVDTNGFVTPLSNVGSTAILMQIEKDGITMDVDIPVFILSNNLNVSIDPEGPIEILSLTSIELNYSHSSLIPGDSIVSENWTSSDPSIVTVDHNGLVTAAATVEDKEVEVNIEIVTNNNMYGMATITITVLPSIKLPVPIVEIVSKGNSKGIFVTDAFIGATATLSARQNKNSPYQTIDSKVIDENGEADFTYLNQYSSYRIILSKEGYIDSDPVVND